MILPNVLFFEAESWLFRETQSSEVTALRLLRRTLSLSHWYRLTACFHFLLKAYSRSCICSRHVRLHVFTLWNAPFMNTLGHVTGLYNNHLTKSLPSESWVGWTLARCQRFLSRHMIKFLRATINNHVLVHVSTGRLSFVQSWLSKCYCVTPK